MTTKLIGMDDATPDGYGGVGYQSICRFQAVATGPMTEFKVKCSGNGTISYAVYADSGGSPGARLAQQATPQAVIPGWNTLPISSVPITIGDYVWLAVYVATGAIGYNTSGGTRKYKAGASTFPDPFDNTGFTNDALSIFEAGWGDTALVVIPSSISQAVGYGTPKLILTIKPSSILQQVAYGTPTVLTSALIIQPSSIVQVVAIGTPILRYPQTLSPPSIVVAIAYGTPSVGTYGIIRPSSIVQQISIGSPTVLKYVWHVILDGQYNTESPEVNRVYFIGQDAYGNPVYGTAVDATEGALVGERLDFQQDLAIPLTTQAASVAAAILSKLRITTKKGLILIPPNCGQELFDVVQISDAGANQAAVSFRVVGLRFEYNPKQARYDHKLILGAP